MYLSTKAQSEINTYKQQISTATTKSIQKHKNKINSIAYNYNNTLLATVSTDHTIVVYTVPDYTVYTTIQEHKSSVDILLWSHNSNILVSGSSDKSIKIYNFKYSLHKAQYTVHTVGENILLAQSNDSQIIAVGDKKNNITLIDYTKLHSSDNTTGNKSAIITVKSHSSEINDIQIIYSQQLQCNLLVYATDLGTIDIYRIDNLNDCIYSHTAHSTAIYTCCYMLEHNVFATGSADALVQLWSLDTMTNLCTYSRCESGISCISISPDCKLIAIGSEDKRIDISAIHQAMHIHTIYTQAEVNTLQWHKDEKTGAYTLAYSDDDNSRNNIGKLYLFSFGGNTDKVAAVT